MYMYNIIYSDIFKCSTPNTTWEFSLVLPDLTLKNQEGVRRKVHERLMHSATIVAFQSDFRKVYMNIHMTGHGSLTLL